MDPQVISGMRSQRWSDRNPGEEPCQFVTACYGVDEPTWSSSRRIALIAVISAGSWMGFVR